ncbi:hypothetical protein BRADI_1g34121v3 [Brachypodium distachyon]|uniref:Uncharacterized protein n=1 Tax=Brachypodium distachyon TaxID=15368 RepID=A0A2K2DMM7_BRADI|nr:hypothetical protein BRADI_1g34121v3 [Brachypodium distachyon]
MYRLTRLSAWCVYSMRYPAYKPVGSFFRRPYGTKQEIPIRYSVQNTVAVRRNPAPSNCQNPRAPPRRPRPAAAGSPVPPALPCQAPSLPPWISLHHATTQPANRRPHLLGLGPPSRAATAVKTDRPFPNQRLSRLSCSLPLHLLLAPAAPFLKPPTAGALFVKAKFEPLS